MLISCFHFKVVQKSIWTLSTCMWRYHLFALVIKWLQRSPWWMFRFVSRVVLFVSSSKDSILKQQPKAYLSSIVVSQWVFTDSVACEQMSSLCELWVCYPNKGVWVVAPRSDQLDTVTNAAYWTFGEVVMNHINSGWVFIICVQKPLEVVIIVAETKHCNS